MANKNGMTDICQAVFSLFLSCSMWSCNGHCLLWSVIQSDSFPKSPMGRSAWLQFTAERIPGATDHELHIREITSFLCVLSWPSCQESSRSVELKVKNSHWMIYAVSRRENYISQTESAEVHKLCLYPERYA